jgi:hypothetical protein
MHLTAPINPQLHQTMRAVEYPSGAMGVSRRVVLSMMNKLVCEQGGIKGGISAEPQLSKEMHTLWLPHLDAMA